ncbi:MAG: response regulator [Solirubrobacterales bacterium]|nr:response regulator [Solirubrobacterales bacterium]
MTISTLIVDDDFRVAGVHAELIDSLASFRVAAVAHTAAAALESTRAHNPDLILLDLYLPDLHGLELLRHLGAVPEPADVIVLSAANDMDSVRTAMQRGALHYLIKPFSYETLTERLRLYAQVHAHRAEGRSTDQSEVDWMFDALRRPSLQSRTLPKGCSRETADLVLEGLRKADGPLSTVQVADAAGVSRTTAHRYLSSLLEVGEVRLSLRYGQTGRPEHRYELSA